MSNVVNKNLVYEYLKQHKKLRAEIEADQVAMEDVRAVTFNNPDELPGGYSPTKISKWNSKIMSKDEKENILREIEMIVQTALSGDQQAIVRMFYFYDLSHKEIEERLRIARGVSANMKYEAINELTDYINRYKIELTYYNR